MERTIYLQCRSVAFELGNAIPKYEAFADRTTSGDADPKERERAALSLWFGGTWRERSLATRDVFSSLRLCIYTRNLDTWISDSLYVKLALAIERFSMPDGPLSTNDEPAKIAHALADLAAIAREIVFYWQ